MSEIRVAYLGPPGTYSHQAARQQFEPLSKNFKITYLPQPTIAQCFQSINDNKCDYSLIPFENSSNGQVVLSYDLFKDWFIHVSKLKLILEQDAKESLKCKADEATPANAALPTPPTSASTTTTTTTLSSEHQTKHPNFNVIAEQFVAIHHNLITFSKDITKIKTIYSHPQVWSQCNKFLRDSNLDNNLKISKIDTSSTSKAVEKLTQLPAGSQSRLETAAIASSTASEIHQVPILKHHIEDHSGNTTRFLVLGQVQTQQEQQQEQQPESQVQLQLHSETSNKKIHLLTFIIRKNDNFGSLCDILAVFKKHNLNLQSITTRPSVVSSWRYVFFVEVWSNDNENDHHDDDGKELDSVIKELNSNELVLDLTVIGSFYRSKKYFEMIGA
ncbi:unnamed protein product [Ambrosiozyma monospora]|uniref:prephenate dehydratase n=1 Tax=Ambrosiozyma monospora TaxID=43982 RepID=A0A9W6Z387_AMBMO|nr:unnamed protein product [Ambrosiozyma monospora]